jgi:hypothetical protein
MRNFLSHLCRLNEYYKFEMYYFNQFIILDFDFK